MKILIYDDEQEQCKALAGMIKEQLQGRPVIHYANTLSEAERLMEQTAYSILFIDIELDHNNNGIELAQKIRKSYPAVELVFITGYIKYCEDIFSAEPDALLIKPFTAERVSRVLDILRKKSDKTDRMSITMGKRQLEKIELKNISYIETKYRYMIFYDTNYRQAYRFYDVKMADIADRMPKSFVRCHKSFFVNMEKVLRLERFRFLLMGDIEVPISQKRYSETKRIFFEYIEDTI